MGLGNEGIGPGRGKPGGGWVAPPVVRLGAIGEAWRLVIDEWGTWVLASLLVLAANGVIHAAVASAFKGPMPGGGGFRFDIPPEGRFIEFVFSAVLDGFFLGGMFRMACLQVRGSRFGVGDLFGASGVVTELAIGAALYAAIVFAASLVFVLPAFVASGVLMFTIPLIVDGRLRAIEAIAWSWNALKGQWFMATVFHFSAYVVAGLGACCFGCGLVFTMPLYCLSIAVLYRDFFVARVPDPASKPVALDPDF